MINKSLIDKNFYSDVLDYQIDDYFFCETKLNDLYNKKLDSLNDSKDYEGKNDIKLKILENYILSIFTKKELSIKEHKIVEFVKNYYYKMFIKYPSLMNDSLIYDNIDIILTQMEAMHLSILKLRCDKKNLSLYNNYFNNNLSEKEINELMLFLIDNILNDEFISINNQVLSFIINKENKNILEYSFMFKYLGYLRCKESSVPCIDVYLTLSSLVKNSSPFSKTAGVFYDSGINIIILNENFFLDKLSLKVDNTEKNIRGIQFLYHELNHYFCSYDTKMGILSRDTLANITSTILRNNLSTSGFDEYYYNYDNRENEVIADENSYRDTLKTLKKYMPDAVDELINLEVDYIIHEENDATAFQKDVESTYSREDYSVRYLSYILNKNPNLINAYSQLKYFYNLDGSLRSLNDLLQIYYLCNKRVIPCLELDVFDDFFIYHFNNLDMNDINFDKMDMSLLIVLFSIVNNLLLKECKNIHQINNIDRNNKMITFSIKYHLDRINKYINFLDNNKELQERVWNEYLSNNEYNFISYFKCSFDVDNPTHQLVQLLEDLHSLDKKGLLKKKKR